MVASSILRCRTIGRLVLGWVTVFGRGHTTLVCNQPATATPANSASYPLWTGNDYRPKCGDALQCAGSKVKWLIPFVDKGAGGG